MPKKIRKNRIATRLALWMEDKGNNSELWAILFMFWFFAQSMGGFAAIFFNNTNGLGMEAFVLSVILMEAVFIMDAVGGGKFSVWRVIGCKVGLLTFTYTAVSILVAVYGAWTLYPAIVQHAFKWLGIAVAAIGGMAALIWLNMKVANKVGGMK